MSYGMSADTSEKFKKLLIFVRCRSIPSKCVGGAFLSRGPSLSKVFAAFLHIRGLSRRFTADFLLDIPRTVLWNVLRNVRGLSYGHTAGQPADSFFNGDGAEDELRFPVNEIVPPDFVELRHHAEDAIR